MKNVAVIIANHNYGEYVCGAINSAANQNYPKDNLRIFVIDDASTDNSVANINEMDHHDGWYTNPEVPYVFAGLVNDVEVNVYTLQENVKQGAARNIAVKEAWDWADYYAILDSDDEMYPDKIRKCVAVLDSDPQIGSVHTDYHIENTETGAVTLECKPPFDKSRLMQGDCMLHSGGVIRKAALEKCGLFDVDVTPKEDYLMWIKISDYFICHHIPEPLVKVRVSPKNSTVSHSDEYHMEKIKLMWERYQQWRQTL